MRRNYFSKYLNNAEKPDEKPAKKPAKKKSKQTKRPKKATPQKASFKNLIKDIVVRIFTAIRNNKFESALIIGLIVFSGTLHAWNMFHFPYFENDESTYLSRGWSFVTEGRLDPYTYRYEHAPFGWMLMGVWLLITGGDLIFPSFLVSGRILMLIVQLASTILIYRIGKNLFNRYVGVLAGVIFSISPLAIYFHRRVLLDNLMALLLLGSIHFLVKKNMTLNGVLMSAILFALAVLTKLNVALCFPALLYIVWSQSHKDMRRHAIVQWIGIVGLISMSYILLAVLKGELLPAPLDSIGEPTRVSLIDSLKLQAGRGDSSLPWNLNGSFLQAVLSWARKDPLIIFGSAATIVISLLLSIRLKSYRYLSLVALGLLAFLVRGKIVIDLYVTPLIPFMALLSSAVLLIPNMLVRKTRWLHHSIGILIIVMVLSAFIFAVPQKEFWKEETNNQLNAVQWIEQNVDKKANIVIDNYAYMQLTNSRGYENADYMFMVEYDPQIRRGVLKDDWRNIDYILLTHEVVVQMGNGSLPLIKEAFLHSELVADYRTGTSSSIDLKNLKSTNGDWAQIYKIKDRRDIILQKSWKHFRDTYFKDYGQIINPTENDVTTSGLLASAMAQAVEQGDKDSFNGIRLWATDHMRYRSTDRLLSWLWEKQDGEYSLADTNTDTAGDIRFAQALIAAYREWGDQAHLTDAQSMIDGIWEQEVFTAGGKLYLDSSADGSIDDRLVNLTYFNPAAFREFAQIDTNPEHNWNKLINDMYGLISRLQNQYGKGLVPIHVIITPGGITTSQTTVPGLSTTEFNSQGTALIHNLSADWKLYKSDEAFGIISGIAEVFKDEIDRGNEITGSYDLLSNDKDTSPNFAMQNGAFIALVTAGYTDQASILFNFAIHAPLNLETGVWGSEEDINSQLIGWQTYHLDIDEYINNRLD